MVKETIENNRTLYMCEVCNMTFKEKEWAEKCEKWCKETKSCNVDIIKHAVKRE